MRKNKGECSRGMAIYNKRPQGNGACNYTSNSDDPCLDSYTASNKGITSDLGNDWVKPSSELVHFSKTSPETITGENELQTQSLPSYTKLQSMPTVMIPAATGLRTLRKLVDSRDLSVRPKCPGLRSTARLQHDNLDNSQTKKEFTEPKEAIEKEDTISQKQDVEGAGQATREPFESFRYPKLNGTRKFRTPSLVPDSANTQHVQTDFKETTTGDAKFDRSDRSYESHSGRESLANDSYKEVTIEPHLEEPSVGAASGFQSLPSSINHSAKSDPPQISNNQSSNPLTFKEHENYSEEPLRSPQSTSNNHVPVQNESSELQETSAKSIPNQDGGNTHENTGRNDENDNSSTEPRNNHEEGSELEGAVGGIDPGTIIPKPTPEELSRRQETSSKCMPNQDGENTQENPGKNDENNSSSTEPRNNHGEEPELGGAVGGIDAETVISKATPEVLSRRPKLRAKRNRRKKKTNSSIDVPNNQNNDNVLPVENSQNNTESKDIKDTNANAQTANEKGNVPNESKAKEAAVASNDIGAVKSECAGGEDSLQAIRDENRRLKESKQCRICRDNDANRMFLPCAHLAACSLCSPAVLNCPQCKAPIRGIVSVYFG